MCFTIRVAMAARRWPSRSSPSMPSPKSSYALPSDDPSSVVGEDHIESGFIKKLQGLKYDYRPDITDRASLERNFRARFEELNRVRLTDAEFADRFLQKCTLAKTCSCKMLTSFKAYTALKLNYHIHKYVFVVDRKDLDRQRREDCRGSNKTSSEGDARRVSTYSGNLFNRFQEGCVKENTNTEALVER